MVARNPPELSVMQKCVNWMHVTILSIGFQILNVTLKFESIGNMGSRCFVVWYTSVHNCSCPYRMHNFFLPMGLSTFQILHYHGSLGNRSETVVACTLANGSRLVAVTRKILLKKSMDMRARACVCIHVYLFLCSYLWVS